MFRVTLAQIATGPDKEENLKKVLRVLNEQSQGSDLVLFPEYTMAYGKPFNREFVKKVAEPLEGEFVKAVRKTAEEIEVNVAINIEELEQNKVFNSTVVIGADGEIKAVYRKIHLFDAFKYRESSIFSSGDSIVLVEVNGVNVGFEICYDIRFPELARILALNGAKVIAVSAGWYKGILKEEQWLTLLKARAHENGVYVLACCHAGEDFIGRSLAIDPLGYVMLDLGPGERVLTVELDISRVDAVRKVIPAIYQRRPEIYSKFGIV